MGGKSMRAFFSPYPSPD